MLDWTFGAPMVLVMYSIFIVLALIMRRYYSTKKTENEAQVAGKKRNRSIDVAMWSMTAALYAALTVALGPISIGISGLNFRISEPVPVIISVLYDPLIAGIGTGIGNLVADSFLGALSWSSMLAFMDSLICRTCTGHIVRDPRKLWIFVPTMAFSATTSATMVATILDFEGIVAFPFMWVSVMMGKIISALVLTPIVVNAIYKAGFYYR